MVLDALAIADVKGARINLVQTAVTVSIIYFQIPILFMVLMLHYYWIFFGSVEEKHLKCLMEGCSIPLFIIGILLHGDPDC